MGLVAAEVVKDPVTRTVVGAALLAALVLIVYVRAPVVPVVVGAVGAGAWVWWRRSRPTP